MGETFLDGKPIGLWNYRERQGDCKGCVVRYSTITNYWLISLEYANNNVGVTLFPLKPPAFRR